MKESPIIFSTPMVQAIMAGQKTQTRRIFKDHPRKPTDVSKKDLASLFKTFPTYMSWFNQYGQIGDLLWVRETWQKIENDRIIYKADYDDTFVPWRPSIYMTKKAARIWLKITDIRIERLHDISEEDAIKEGIRVPVSDDASVWFAIGKENSAIQFLPNKVFWGEIKPTQFELLKAFFAELWCDINGRDSWDANPWVWVITFEKYDR